MRFKNFGFSTFVPWHIVQLIQHVDPLSLRAAISEVTLAFTMSGVSPGLKW